MEGDLMLYLGDFKSMCVVCERVFDLLVEDEAGEVAYGHDCEVT